ncbi:DUF11 domain-containing protein [Paenibacillus sp. JSM ZJ436]|uniref:DUF11 domain-containing protein n=1 Tax=Paenibacillus sp. JSM ZJ436 TaxID=3376190 RepID=UPI0037BB45CF
MSQAGIPNITPSVGITINQTIPLLLSSIALEEVALAHLMNAEAEKLQYVLGTLGPAATALTPATVTVSNLLLVDQSVRRTLQDVIKKEMLLEFKFENVLDLIQIVTPPPPPPPVLTIEKTDNPDPVIVLGPTVLTYTITVTNTGPGTATNVIVTDTLPPVAGPLGPTFTLNVLSLPADCVLVGLPVGGTVICNVGTLLPGEVRVITFNGLVTSLVSGVLSNTSTVTSNETAPVQTVEETQAIVP